MDCATGNGQAAVGLAAHFELVIAVDASEAQLEHAVPHPRVEYRVLNAEATGLPDGCLELITVAQAFHWFRPERFYAEARRMLMKGGALVVWAYGLPEINGAIDAILRDHYGNALAGYWPEQRNYVDDEYRTLEFPLSEVDAPEFRMVSTMTSERLAGYVSSWSATRKYMRELGHNPFEERLPEVAAAWGDNEEVEAHWPMYVRAGYFRD